MANDNDISVRAIVENVGIRDEDHDLFTSMPKCGIILGNILSRLILVDLGKKCNVFSKTLRKMSGFMLGYAREKFHRSTFFSLQ